MQNKLKDSFSLKICRIFDSLINLNTLPLNILHSLYCSLIVTHLHHGILPWSYNLNNLSITKKKLRIITGSKYNAHTEPFLKATLTLKIEDISKLQYIIITY